MYMFISKVLLYNFTFKSVQGNRSTAGTAPRQWWLKKAQEGMAEDEYEDGFLDENSQEFLALNNSDETLLVQLHWRPVHYRIYLFCIWLWSMYVNVLF